MVLLEERPGVRGGVSVLGCGRWGSFHLWYSSRLGFRTAGWEPPGSEPLGRLSRERANDFLTLPPSVELTDDLGRMLDCEWLILAVPVQRLRELARSLSGRLPGDARAVLCMKGLERGTGLRPSEILREEGIASSVTAWVGPGHPALLVAGQPTCMLAVSEDEGMAAAVCSTFGSRLIRMYSSADMTGCELGAASKNVVGIAAGMLDGLGLPGLKGALMARAPLEMARLCEACGGSWRSAYGLAHLGDYEATLFSPHSRNRAWGEALATGGPLPGGTAEGVETCGAIELLAARSGVEVPITSAVGSVIRGESTPADAVSALFDRPVKGEFP